MGWELPGIVIVGLVLCGLVLLVGVGVGVFMLLVQLGVIVREARRPPHSDAGNYRLDQGREVRSEDERR